MDLPGFDSCLIDGCDFIINFKIPIAYWEGLLCRTYRYLLEYSCRNNRKINQKLVDFWFLWSTFAESLSELNKNRAMNLSWDFNLHRIKYYLSMHNISTIIISSLLTAKLYSNNSFFKNCLTNALQYKKLHIKNLHI